MKLGIETIVVPLRDPWVTGHGVVAQRELLLVSLDGGDGLIGYGEAAPLFSYDATELSDAADALQACRPVLAAGDELSHPELLARCAEVAPAPQALAAIDEALWDLAGKRAGQPVWRLLGVARPAVVQVNWTIAASDRAGAAREASVARAAGFQTLKAKVAIGDDAGRLAAVRAAAGPGMRIRIDANGAWSMAQARASLRALAPVGIELCEEPVSGVAQIRELAAHTEIPLALDESAAEPGALAQRACGLVCLKISRCGGLSGVLHAARRALAVGYEVYLASTLDGPLAISAALHAAAALAPRRACGLATLGLFGERPDLLAPRDGAIAVPAGAGLGDGLAAWYQAT